MPSTYSGDGATFDTSPHFTSIANILIRAYVNHPDRRDAINDLLGIAQELARAMPRVPTAVAYIEFQKYVFDELARVTTPYVLCCTCVML